MIRQFLYHTTKRHHIGVYEYLLTSKLVHKGFLRSRRFDFYRMFKYSDELFSVTWTISESPTMFDIPAFSAFDLPTRGNEGLKR